MAGRKWTPEQHKKFKEAMSARKKSGLTSIKKVKNTDNSADAVNYLAHAERQIIERIRTGREKHLQRSDLLTLLAYDTLRAGR